MARPFSTLSECASTTSHVQPSAAASRPNRYARRNSSRCAGSQRMASRGRPADPRLSAGAAKAGARAAIRIAARRPELLRGPDLALTGGLVAVVLERGETTVHPLEHVEAPPEERGPQRSARVDLLREREVGKWQPV